MKRTSKALRAQVLDTTQLARATGGRGSWCGAVIHCDCGYAFTPTGSYACPSCGAQAFDGEGGGGGDDGCPFNNVTCLV